MMSPQISANQQQVLHEAIDTLDSEFIAKCVLNIEIILRHIKRLIRLSEGDWESSIQPAEQAIHSDYADCGLVEVKEEPTVEWGEQEPTSMPGHEELKLSAKDSHQQGSRAGKLPAPLSPHPTFHSSAVNPEAKKVSSATSKKRHTDRKSLDCDHQDCSFTAKTKVHWTQHMQKVHPERCQVLKCEQCEFTTIKRANLRQHVKTHLPPEEKPYKCSICSNYSSANKEGLRIHINTAHKGVKPYLCDTCGQSFTGISMLSKHKLMKHKPKHLKCPHCDYRTSLVNWLKDHMKRHSSDTPFTCQHCSYAAKTAGRLKVHLRIHTGERPYKCHMCSYSAIEGAPLKKHLKNQHQLSVHRIDIREGKLFTTEGREIDTGLSTRTAPLPATSFHGNKDKLTTNQLSLPSRKQNETSIIVEAAALSALPIHPESPSFEAVQSSNYIPLPVTEPVESTGE